MGNGFLLTEGLSVNPFVDFIQETIAGTYCD